MSGSDFLVLLVVLGIEVALITVVGARLWLVCAALFRAMTSTDKSIARQRICTACGRYTSAAKPHCDWCGMYRAMALIPS